MLIQIVNKPNLLQTSRTTSSNQPQQPTTKQRKKESKKNKQAKNTELRSTNTNSMPNSENVNQEQITQETNTTRQTKRKIFIVGDSMLNGLEGHKMSRRNIVKIWPLPGANTADMAHHIQPLIRRKPDEVVLHFGTNDLRDSESAQSCAQGIIDLAKSLENHSIKSTVSALITRSDNKQLEDKRKKVNNNLERLCRESNINYIKHDNIKDNNLNGGGLHLNTLGKKLLAINFINYIKSK